MSVNDLLTFISRATFIFFTAVTVVDYLRHRDPTRRDIALVFVSLSCNSIISIILGVLNVQSPLLTKLGQIGIVALPYMLLRLVSYFRAVPRSIKIVAIVGWAVASALLVLFTAPLALGLTFPIILYFIVIIGYTTVAFIRTAISSTGIARHRLRFAAVGSVLVVLLIVIAGVRVVEPKTWLDITPIVQTLLILTIIIYYLGFAPPRWLRRGWQFTELQRYMLQDRSTFKSQSASDVLALLRQAVIRVLATDKVFVALWDREGKQLALEDNPEAAALHDFNWNEGVFKEAAERVKPVAIDWSDDPNAETERLMKALKAEMLFFVPFSTNEGAVGLLLASLEFSSLFIDDDLNLLAIFAQQTAMLLENLRILDAQRLYAQDLERVVQARTEELRRSNDELRQFAYIASHDLQEPLRMIVSYLQLVEKRYANLLDQDGREFIDFAVDGAKRMKALIEGLLAYSRVETQIQNFAPVDSQKILDEVRNLLKISIEESNATITSHPLPKINGNEQMMIQLFQNLISNAIKYQKDNVPSIQIDAVRQDKDWVFSVKDNGIGIEAKDLERIFVIFQRLHARGEYPGTGIGLAVCKKVVEHHGGRIWVESKVGEGTTFFFTIPATLKAA